MERQESSNGKALQVQFLRETEELSSLTNLVKTAIDKLDIFHYGGYRKRKWRLSYYILLALSLSYDQ